MSQSSVGDFAAQLMAQDREASTPQHVPFSHPVGPDELNQPAPDISDVAIPINFVESLLENTEPKEQEVVVEVEESMYKVESTESPDLQNLLEEVRDLLVEVKSQLHEMTSVGMGGVGPGRKAKKKKEEDEDDLSSRLKAISRRAATR